MFRKITYIRRILVHSTSPSLLFRQCLSTSHVYGSDKQCHYATLGVAKNSSTEEIRAAYMEKSKEFHPDYNVDDPTAHNTFVKINDAYTVLKNSKQRSAYDSLGSSGFTSNISSTSPFGTYQETEYEFDVRNYASTRHYDFKGAQPKRENLMNNSLLIFVLLSFSIVGSWLLYLRVRHVHDTQSERLEKLSLENIALHQQLRDAARRNGPEKQLALFIAKVSPSQTKFNENE